ncbi:MAG: hypothetical protein KC613_15460 [Myxococcales bacterium]|nr:hypothetical protein [Myxococcales bacterium]MCB9522535.1 hypothetical protein [Myxococcales bacterium]
MHRWFLWSVAAAAALPGCDDEAAAPVPHALTVYGEAFVEEGIPAAETDGWAVTFREFLVCVHDPGAVGGPALSGAQVFDLTQASGGEGHAAGALPGGPFSQVRWRVAPCAGGVAGNASAAQVQAMNAGGYALWVAGEATKGAETKTFAWGFDTDTTYGPCATAPTETAEGVRSMLTVHADHLLYDDLVSETPNVAFQALADADADGDGAITPAELAAIDITGFARYQVGSNTAITDLWAFLEAQSRTVGHIDGEGHCERQ